MPRYTYEIEYIPDPPDEAPVGDKTTARMVKSVMTSSVEFQNENQLHAHLRERMKKPGNWKTRLRNWTQNAGKRFRRPAPGSVTARGQC